MDTLIAKEERSKGVDDQRYCVVMLDEATYYTDAFPGAKRNDAESSKALNEYEGPRDRIKSVYSDGAPEFKSACRRLRPEGVTHDLSTP